MCGIYGALASDRISPVETRRAETLTDLLSHRGPDRRGVHAMERCVFGHRRLCIIDLDARADQPFRSADGRFMVTFNGEIYNYRELRAQLNGRGYVHTTDSDTEVLLNGYRCWGAECLDRLEGMFAFAIYDSLERRLFAARDHMGQKPFYFTRTRSHLLFASELRVLLNHPDVAPVLSIRNFQKYLLYDFYPWDTTPIEGVHKLPPAHLLTVNDRLDVEVGRYWDSVPGAGDAPPLRDGQFGEAMRDAIRKHLVADVPVGVWLSGGLDSSLIGALASRERAPLDAFTVAVRSQGFDESAVAAQVARHIGAVHHVSTLDESDAAACAEAVLGGLDEPVADPGLVPSFAISRAARQRITVALAGDGGDEIGAGYITFRGLSADRLVRRLPGPVVAALAAAAGYLPATDGYMSPGYLLENFLKAYPAPSLLRTQLWIAPFHPRAALRLISQDHAAGTAGLDVNDPASVFEDLWTIGRPVDGYGLGDQMLYLFQKLFLPEYVCAHTDRASMMHGLEVRSPFLHRPVVELLNAQPFSVKRSGGQGKRPLYDLARPLLPESVLTHKKHGFTFPVGAWLRGALKPLVDRLLAPDRLALGGLLDVAAVRSIVDEHLSGRANRQKPLWNLLVFQQWLENFPQVRIG